MSSEESGEDESEQPVIYVKPLPWRHPQVNKFFMQMDDRIERKKSKRAKIQTLPRVQGQVSQRPDQQSFHITSGDLVQTNRKPGISLKVRPKTLTSELLLRTFWVIATTSYA